MTIRKGEPWGESGIVPDDLVVVHSDRALAAVVARRRIEGAVPTPIGLAGGDLARAVGAVGGARFAAGTAATILPIDLMRVTVDGEHRWVVAHVVARRPGRFGWFRGELVAAMNGQYLGRWDVAPRAHPNDARVDVVRVDAAMSIRDRWRARSRLPHARHLPHPSITVRSASHVTIETTFPLTVWLDGVRWRSTARFEITVEPDAAFVAI